MDSLSGKQVKDLKELYSSIYKVEKSAEKQGLDTKQIEQDLKEVKDEVEDIAGSVKRNN